MNARIKEVFTLYGHRFYYFFPDTTFISSSSIFGGKKKSKNRKKKKVIHRGRWDFGILPWTKKVKKKTYKSETFAGIDFREHFKIIGYLTYYIPMLFAVFILTNKS